MRDRNKTAVGLGRIIDWPSHSACLSKTKDNLTKVVLSVKSSFNLNSKLFVVLLKSKKKFVLLRTEQECGEHVVSEPVEHCHGGHGHEVSFAI